MAIDNMTPQQLSQQWINRLRESAPRYRAAINALQNNPLEAAAARETEWGNACQAAARDGRFSAGLRSVTFADWKQRAATIGGNALQNLDDLKQQRTIRFWNRFRPVLINARNQVRAMPRGTYQERKARANAMMDALHAARAGQGGGGNPLMLPAPAG